MVLVSVIVPAYNAEKYIGKCLTSVIEQSYKNIEIFVVNDGSEDRTELIVKKYQRKYRNIKLLNIENNGQGHARNLALKRISGKYVMFLDADDFIEPQTIELSVEILEKEMSDLVMFDWKYFHDKGGWYSYNHVSDIYPEKLVEGDDKMKLLKAFAYFTVNKVYRTDFLRKNNINYMEGYIYEDIPFWVSVVIFCKRVSLIYKPFYNVRIGNSSTTNSEFNTDKHAKGFIEAVKISLLYAKNSSYRDQDFYFMYRYFVHKFQIYRKKRIPEEVQQDFTRDFLHSMRDIKIDLPISNKLISYAYRFRVFSKERYYLFNILILLKNLKKSYREKNKRFKQIVKRHVNNRKVVEEEKLICTLKKQYGENIILFMGFDYKYTGNSRYLFEEIISKNHKNIEIYFVTDNNLVDSKYKIVPNSIEFKALIQKAKVIIFESWIPLWLKKLPNTIWIQLWHGTPVKKMLFDSDEREIVFLNPKHKNNKFNDIKRWNYLICDSPNVSKYFSSAFLVKNLRILPLGYPRVKYLIENSNNIEAKCSIKKTYSIDNDKKVIAYLPTWRDYNYGDNRDYEFLLNVEALQESLGDDYIVISKEHTFLNEHKMIYDIETQELLLISDCVITDYSSVIFDAVAIDIPVILYCTDFDKYQNSRGVYESVWMDLEDLVINDIDELIKKIKNIDFSGNVYEKLKRKYCYNNYYQKDLSEIILKYFDKGYFNGFVKRALIKVNNSTDTEQAVNVIEGLKEEGFTVYVSTEKTSYYGLWKNYKLIQDVFLDLSGKELEDIVDTYQIYQVIDLTL